MGNRRYAREFSYTRPIMYQGEWYPSADTVVSDGKGNERKGRMFTDSNGNYFTLDENGNALSAMPVVNQQEEVVVTAPNLLSKRFNDYLRASNDATMVGNIPHRKYNTNLTEDALSGAKAHAAWDRKHPNLSAWRDAATAVPFAVAAAPVALGAGEVALGTAAGQTVGNGLAALMGNPIVDAANTTLGLGFAGKGAYDVSQGEFTPGTAMDLAGGAGLLSMPIYKSLTGFNKARASRNFVPSIADDVANRIKSGFPLKGETEIPIGLRKEAAQKYTDFINSDEYHNRLQRARLEDDHWQYMKDLTNRRVNNNGYFPSRVQPEINNDPSTIGLSSAEPSSPNYGISLQEDLSSQEVFPTLMHEMSHWATGNAGISDMANSVKYPFRNDPNVNYIGDIMRYNESIAPYKEWDEILNGLPESMPIDRVMEIQDTYHYLTRPTEIRARLMSVYQQAKDAGMTPEAFVAKHTKDGKILPTASNDLQQLGDIFTIDNLKKRLGNFLSIAAPVGIVGASKR